MSEVASVSTASLSDRVLKVSTASVSNRISNVSTASVSDRVLKLSTASVSDLISLEFRKASSYLGAFFVGNCGPVGKRVVRLKPSLFCSDLQLKLEAIEKSLSYGQAL
jgi:hypothetical protein